MRDRDDDANDAGEPEAEVSAADVKDVLAADADDPVGDDAASAEFTGDEAAEVASTEGDKAVQHAPGQHVGEWWVAG